jgi:hypothetical protein
VWDVGHGHEWLNHTDLSIALQQMVEPLANAGASLKYWAVRYFPSYRFKR